MNMVILLLVLTLAIRPAYSPIHTGTWHMHVVNGMSHGMRLLVHCRSGDTDLGMKNVTAGTEFEWKFKMNFFDRTVYWCYWYSVFNKFRVHLINGFKNSTLEAHCKSEKGSDFGHQHIPVHQEFSWKFYTYLFGKTRYYCDLGWSNGRKGMDVFKIKDDFLDAYCGYDFCRWLFKEDGIYSYYFKHKQFQFQFKWDK
ncbi:hypothetical protein ACOSQ3_003488 [Xanthoceras sorbifolium]